MSEVQSQQIVQRQKISEDGTSELDMTTVDDKRVSKLPSEAITFGKAVSEHLKKRVLKFSKAHVGEDSIFPTKNGMPKVLTHFFDKPYEFELRDVYEGDNPKALPSV